MPLRSPGRAGLVVTETERWTSGRCARTRLTTVPLPAPEGPEMTNSEAAGPNGSGLRLTMGELGEQVLFLFGAKPPHAPRFGYVETLHDLARSYTTDAGQ